MLYLKEIVAPSLLLPAKPVTTVTLTLDERRRSRLRVTLDDGREGAIFLPRGSALREGDLLRAHPSGDHGDHGENDGEAVGQLVLVHAATESLSVARTSDSHLLLRGAYHLGNRHVPVELGDGWLAYEHDHVLDDMVRGLGLTVERRTSPFEPEGGAFRHDGPGNHTHPHPHDGPDAHSHAHGGSHHRHS